MASRKKVAQARAELAKLEEFAQQWRASKPREAPARIREWLDLETQLLLGRLGIDPADVDLRGRANGR